MGETKFPDVTNWVGAIDRDIGVAFRYALTLQAVVFPVGSRRVTEVFILRQNSVQDSRSLDFLRV